MIKRSETLFVNQVNADRRKRVVNTLFASFDVIDRNILFMRVLSSALVLAGAIGMFQEDINWGYVCLWTWLAWAGVIIWAACGLLGAAKSYGCFEFALLRETSPMAPGTVVETTALDDMAKFTCRLGGLCLTGIATISTITHFGRMKPKVDAIITTCLVSGLLLNAMLMQISFKSFSGLYAPIAPHRFAPTILPLFALSTGAAGVCCACVGLQFQPQSLLTLRLVNLFRLLAWLQWHLEASGTFNTSHVNRQRAKRLARRQEDGYYDQERTPITGTPQIKEVHVR